jgi:serine protease AprX
MGKVKVFCPKGRQNELQNLLNNPIYYDAFVVGNAEPPKIEEIKQKFPIEDMSYLDSIQVKGLTVDTSTKKMPELRKIPKGSHYYIVQFAGPIKQEWLANIEKIGGRLVEPFPNFSYIVEMGKAVLSKVSGLEHVNWIGHYGQEFRLSRKVLDNVKKSTPKIKKKKKNDIKNAISKLDRRRLVASESQKPTSHTTEAFTVPNKYSINFFSTENFEQSRKLMKRHGVKIIKTLNDDKRAIVDLEDAKGNPADILSELSQMHGVKRIEEVKIPKLFNNVACGIMNAIFDAASAGTFTGKGEIIGVADTGLDSGDLATMHPDFKGRIKTIRSYPINLVFNSYLNNPGGDDGPKDNDSGHGTHVAGSVLGDGSSSIITNQKPPVRGLAYGAKLVFQAIEQWMDWNYYGRMQFLMMGKQPPEYMLSGIPDELSELFDYAYKNGCRIHTNSWGGGNFGEYDQQSEQLDRFVWENKDFTVLFAGGNDGSDLNRDGMIDLRSVTPPGTAKNCITVGAGENQRPEWTSETYGKWWPKDFPAPQLNTDPMSDSSTDIAAFSSRGPTIDGRIKPDVIAPGTFILSTRSRYIAANNFAWGKFTPNNDYFFMGGTSMATPLVAGATAVVRQFLRTVVQIKRPSAALIKATLIHGSKRLKYRYEAQNRKGLYDFEQGWGMINLKESIESDDGSSRKVKYIDYKKGLNTGESISFEMDVSNPAAPLKVTLAWTDYPGPGLINNLNLIVTAPNGKRYHGNVFEEPFDSRLDSTNNVEAVFIQNPIAGKYKIEVIGSNVTEETQDFALVYSGFG